MSNKAELSALGHYTHANHDLFPARRALSALARPSWAQIPLHTFGVHVVWGSLRRSWSQFEKYVHAGVSQ